MPTSANRRFRGGQGSRASANISPVDSSLLPVTEETMVKIPFLGGRLAGPSSTQYGGWRGSLRMFCIFAWFLFVLNTAVSIYLTTLLPGVASHKSFTEGVPLMKGDCKSIGNADTWLHLGMNVLSAGLLASTNFAMQIWTALTRHEIDSVHKDGDTADIAIPSFRNMIRIRPARLILWSGVFIAALPLHLIFNSAVYSTIPMNDYNIFFVTPDFFSRSFTATRTSDTSNSSYIARHGMEKFHRENTEWEHLSLKAINDIYISSTSKLSSSYRDLVFVSDDDPQTWSNVSRDYRPGATEDGIISRKAVSGSDRDGHGTGRDGVPSLCFILYNLANLDNCRPGQPVQEMIGYDWDRTHIKDGGERRLNISLRSTGLIERIEVQCRLMGNPLFWWVTTVCNFFIACCLAGMVRFYRGTPLITIGDVIDSFLTEPPASASALDRDSTNNDSLRAGVGRSACTYDVSSFKNIFRPRLYPREYSPQKRRWWKAVGLKRWTLTTLWYFLMLLIVTVLFLPTISTFNGTSLKLMSIKEIFADGLTSLDPVSLADNTKHDQLDSLRLRLDVVAFVLLANSPQLFVSVTHVLYNAILTSMLAEHEWHKFGTDAARSSPKSLRTSQPRGSQRSTYFLSLPYRYGIPFVVVSAVIQWLVSQTLFFGFFDIYDVNGRMKVGGSDVHESEVSRLGYSPLAILWVLVIGLVAWVAILALGLLRTYPAGMPLLGCSSVVIAAACYPPDDDVKFGYGEYAAAGPVSWGVVRQTVLRDGQEVEEQWLGFRPGSAEKPVAGEVYG